MQLRRNRIQVALLSLIGMFGCGTSAPNSEAKRSDGAPTTAPTEVDLDVIDGVEPLRAMFNADADKLRVIALLEPG